MQNITPLQWIGTFILITFGFAMKWGTLYQATQKPLSWWKVFFLAVFSYGSGVLAFLLILEKDWSEGVKLSITWFASFIGYELIPGLGSIKAAFFKEIAEDTMKKWLNNKVNDSSTIQTETEIEENDTLEAENQ